MEKIVVKNSINIWTESFGNKNNHAILLIAGAHAPSTFWPDFFCKELANAGYFVIRYDHRDIGYSTHFPVTKDLNKPVYTLADLAEDALNILDDYNIQKAHFIGHSMGGAIVQYLTVKHPDRTLSAISISINISEQILEHPKYKATMQELFKNKPTGNFKKDWAGWLNSWKLLHGDIPIDEQMAKNYTQSIYNRHQGDFNPAWNHIAAGMTKTDLSQELPDNLLLIHGEEDILALVDEIKALKNKFNVIILPEVGHVFFNKTIWEQITECILNFLD
ncbi:MAG: alpha/beta hydrolase [Gammaproteobacteria bacterium]|jgi:pimeloyl-ACP methyl ester carboxylesterase